MNVFKLRMDQPTHFNYGDLHFENAYYQGLYERSRKPKEQPKVRSL